MVSVLHRRPWRRDLLVALGCYGVLLALLQLQVQPLQLPGYLLILGFDAVQNHVAPGLGGGAFQAALGAYLFGLAAIAATIAARLRRRFGPAGPVRYGVAGAILAFTAYGLLAGFASLVRLFTGELPAPLLALVAGLAGLWIGWRLAGPGPRAEGE